MPYETVIYERKGRIAYITLNRPEALNAFNDQQEADMRAAFAEFDMDEEAWVAILNGSGRCFSAGADVKQRFAGPPTKQKQHNQALPPPSQGYIGPCANWKPIIAAIHKYALGAGCSVTMECDMIVATEDSQFGITETKRGLPGGNVWAKMHHAMPSKVGVEMLLTGEMYPATELYRLGLINRLVPAGQHLQAAEELAEKVLKAPPLAVRAGVRVARWPMMQKIAENGLYVQALHLHQSEDFAESSQSFVEKRDPVYKGR